METQKKRVALGIDLQTSYGRRKLQGVLAYMRRHQSWDIPLRNALPVLSERELLRWNGDGAIIETYSDEVGKALLKRGIPVVNTYSQNLHPPLPTVTINNTEVGRLAAKHLLQKGIDRFAFFGLSGLRYCKERLHGFSEVLLQHHCSCETHWIDSKQTPGQLTQPHLYLQKLTSLPKPVSLFATNDRVGFGILAACRQLGLPSPDTVALVAVDDDETLCSLAIPQMSSINLATEQIGYRAAERLAHMMAGEEAPLFWEELPPHAVMQRHSSDVMSLPDPLVAEALRVIRSHVREGLNVASVMQTLSGSRRTLERRFRSVLGQSIYEVILRARIEAAQHLLRESDKSVSEIARATGFNSITRFGIAFRTLVGTSASEYRSTLS